MGYEDYDDGYACDDEGLTEVEILHCHSCDGDFEWSGSDKPAKCPLCDVTFIER